MAIVGKVDKALFVGKASGERLEAASKVVANTADYTPGEGVDFSFANMVAARRAAEQTNQGYGI